MSKQISIWVVQKHDTIERAASYEDMTVDVSYTKK